MESIIYDKIRKRTLFYSIRFKAKDKKPTIDEIEQILIDNIKFATITKKEDKSSRDAGLNHKMPEEYYDVNNKLYDNPFARYEKIGLVVK